MWYPVVLAEILRNHIKSRLSDCWPWWYIASPAETEDLFDPLEDSHTLNTFTRRDHLFARLEFLLEKGGVTLFHQDRRGDTLHESGVIQLEFSGTQSRVWTDGNLFQGLFWLNSVILCNGFINMWWLVLGIFSAETVRVRSFYITISIQIMM